MQYLQENTCARVSFLIKLQVLDLTEHLRTIGSEYAKIKFLSQRQIYKPPSLSETDSTNFCEELLSENEIEDVLAILGCYEYGAKASEAVQKIVTDQKEYRKCSSCVIIC